MQADRISQEQLDVATVPGARPGSRMGLCDVLRIEFDASRNQG